MRSVRVVLVALVAAVAVVAAVAIGEPGRASAHASLISSSPATNETLRRPPTRVVLHFSEAIERKLTAVQVTGKDGQRVDDGQVAFDDNDPAFASVGLKSLQPGLYFVKWSNVSHVDGHNYEGTYAFIVLNPDGTFPPGVTVNSVGSATTSGGGSLPGNLDSALKWIAMLSLATGTGAAFMFFAGLRPAAAFLEDEPYQKFTDAAERWVINLAHVLLPVSFIASAFLVLLTVSRFATSTGLVSYLTSVRTGQYRLADLVLLLVALAGADLLFLGRSARMRNFGLGVLIGGCVGAIFTYSMISHGATTTGKVWSVTSDFIHFGASAAWLGALAMLLPLLRWGRRDVDETNRFLLLANAFDRFSIIAGLSVMVILATGTFNGLVEIPNAGAMIHTTYGRVLLAKLALMMPLLAVAGLNAYVLKPRVVAAIDGVYQQGGSGDDSDRARWQRQIAWLQRMLPRTVAVEIALVLGVFAVVGVLSQTSTARGEVAQQEAARTAAAKFHETGQAGDLQVTLDVTPNQVGINEYDVTLTNADGAPSKTVSQVRLRVNYDQVPGLLPPSELILSRRGDGDFRDQSSNFTQPGNWRVEIDVRRTDADDVSRQFVLGVARTAAGAGAAKGGAFALPFTVFNWNEAAGAFIALGGVAIVLYRRQLRWLRQPGYRIGMGVATALMLSGAVLVFGVHSHTAAVDPTAGNPVKPAQASVDRGKALFAQNCAVCHGVDGRGDGPQAAQLNPSPADFRLHIPFHTDPQFFNFISNGYPGSAMPQFKGGLSEQDIWNLINYLRSAFSQAATQ